MYGRLKILWKLLKSAWILSNLYGICNEFVNIFVFVWFRWISGKWKLKHQQIIVILHAIFADDMTTILQGHDHLEHQTSIYKEIATEII